MKTNREIARELMKEKADLEEAIVAALFEAEGRGYFYGYRMCEEHGIPKWAEKVEATDDKEQ